MKNEEEFLTHCFISELRTKLSFLLPKKTLFVKIYLAINMKTKIMASSFTV